MLGALVILAFGSLVSALAPEFAVLAVAQALVGVGIGVSYSAAVAATAEWSTAGTVARAGAHAARAAARMDRRDAARRDPRRDRLADRLARRSGLDGPGCRWAPAPAARHASRERAAGLRSVLRYPGVARWTTGELFAFSGWAGALVYMGALLVESYDLSIAATGLALGFGALVYVPGNFLFRRWVDAHGRLLLVGLALAAAVTVACLGAFARRSGSAWRSSRSSVSSPEVEHLRGAPEGSGSRRSFGSGVTGVRAAAIQAGYFVGAAVGGAALAIGGYGTLGLAFAALFVGAAVPHLVPLR